MVWQIAAQATLLVVKKLKKKHRHKKSCCQIRGGGRLSGRLAPHYSCQGLPPQAMDIHCGQHAGIIVPIQLTGYDATNVLDLHPVDIV